MYGWLQRTVLWYLLPKPALVLVLQVPGNLHGMNLRGDGHNLEDTGT